MNKWCIRVWSEQFHSYAYMTMWWFNHDSAAWTMSEFEDRVGYDTREFAQHVIDSGRKAHKYNMEHHCFGDHRPLPYWEKAEPFEYELRKDSQ